MATTGKTKEEMSESGKGGQQAADPIEMLKADHRAVEKLFAEHEKAPTRAKKAKIFEQIATALKVHAALEEQIFYRAVREEAEADDKLDEAQVEHDTVKILIQDLEANAGSQFRDAKVKVLSEYVQHHVKEEEAPDGILEQGRKAGLDLAQLGMEMAKRKQELERDPSSIDAEPVAIELKQPEKSGGSTRQKAETKTGRSSARDSSRSEASERRGSRGGDEDRSERSSRERYEDRREDDYYRSRDRDERYRSAEDQRGRGRDDDDYYDDRYERSDREYEDERQSRQRRSREDDRDRDEGRGWHGDPRGHSEAARRGWDNRH